MLNEFRDFLLLIPLMIITPIVLQRENYWRLLLVAFFLVGTWIAFMGVVEYWFPQVTDIFPAFIHAVKPELTDEGFARGQFSFWGGSQATFICAMALPIALVLVTWWPRWYSRAVIVLAAVFQMLAIYIGGYRSLWFLLILQIVVACVLRLQKHGVAVAVLCLVVGVGGYHYIPNTTERAMTGIAALRGQPVDHSAQERKDRAFEAIDQAAARPFGSGWSSRMGAQRFSASGRESGGPSGVNIPGGIPVYFAETLPQYASMFGKRRAGRSLFGAFARFYRGRRAPRNARRSGTSTDGTACLVCVGTGPGVVAPDSARNRIVLFLCRPESLSCCQLSITQPLCARRLSQ